MDSNATAQLPNWISIFFPNQTKLWNDVMLMDIALLCMFPASANRMDSDISAYVEYSLQNKQTKNPPTKPKSKV